MFSSLSPAQSAGGGLQHHGRPSEPGLGTAVGKQLLTQPLLPAVLGLGSAGGGHGGRVAAKMSLAAPFGSREGVFPTTTVTLILFWKYALSRPLTALPGHRFL